MSQDLGKLILRIAVGGLLLFHGIAKVRTGVAPIGQLLAGMGLPAFIAYGTYLGEFVAPLLLLLGLFTRPAAAVVVINMSAAIALAHLKQLGSVVPGGGWALELPALYLLGALAICFLGSGRLAVTRGRGRFD